MKRKLLVLLVAITLITGSGCSMMRNTHAASAGINGAGTVAVVGPVMLGAFVGKLYWGRVTADLEPGDSMELSDQHQFSADVGVASTEISGDGDATGTMDRHLKIEVIPTEGGSWEAQ